MMGHRERDAAVKIVFITLFSITMAFLEATVVVYLRQIYYPSGFTFPLTPMPSWAIGVEVLREMATLVMLASVAGATSRDFSRRLAYFLYCFGVWDIFYYIWLKVLLDWPPSVMTWDILFLIPIAWAGPVLAPIAVSLTMITLAGALLSVARAGVRPAMSRTEWVMVLAGGIVVFAAFVWEYSRLAVTSGLFVGPPGEGKVQAFLDAVSAHIPSDFNWPLFVLGEILIICAVIMVWNKGHSAAKRSKFC
jgi:hypothetical protein